jgi:cytidylate kinase
MDQAEVLLIGGRAGVGKTTMGWEIAARLRAETVAHGAIEGGFMGQTHPFPVGDPRRRKTAVDQDQMLAFYDFPAEHGIRLRTRNPIESTFTTVGPRAKVRKLVESVQQQRRVVNAPRLVALVCAGSRFEGGRLVERPEAVAA